MTPEISVVIVAYRSADDLEELLPELDDPRLEVIVMDNDSPDDGHDVAVRHSHVQAVQVGTNAGWSRACNLGAQRSTAPVIAFVNPDARPRPDDLTTLLSRLVTGVASVSPAFVDEVQQPQAFLFRFPRPVMGAFIFFNAGLRIDRWLGSFFMRRRTYDYGRGDVREVDHAGAACLLVRRTDFLDTGGFDEDMWLFFSDTDWCLRRAESGLVNAVATDVLVVHEGGGSVRHEPSEELQQAFLRDYFTYARKNYGAVGLMVTRLGALAFVGLLPALAALVSGRANEGLRRLRSAWALVR